MPYEGVLGDGNGKGGEVVTYSPKGRSGNTHVYANIITDSIGPEGPQGWSFSVRFAGDAGMTAVTTSGTSVDKYIHEGFNITMLAQDVRGSSWRGAVSAVALSTTGFPALPGTGTESVLLSPGGLRPAHHPVVRGWWHRRGSAGCQRHHG